MYEAPFLYRNVAHRVEIQFVHTGTCGTQPEELCVGGSTFKRIKIAAIEMLELFAAT
jgi:hypothetical protein